MVKEKDFTVVIAKLKAGVTNFTESDVKYYRQVKGWTDTVLVQFADGKTELYDAS
jgi:hypothetical protein